IKGKELAALAEDAEAVAKEQRPEEATRTLQAVGEVAVASRDDDLAARYFARASDIGSSSMPLVRWGDVLSGRKRWEKAAEAYSSACAKDPRQPLPVYLHGYALMQAGRKKDGESLMEQAHWLPLGDDNVRVEFARALLMRGHVEASRR